MQIIVIITCIYKARFLTGAHSALQLLTTFTMTKYTSATDALWVVQILPACYTHTHTTHTHTHACTHSCAHTTTHTHTHACNLHAHMCMDKHTHIYTPRNTCIFSWLDEKHRKMCTKGYVLWLVILLMKCCVQARTGVVLWRQGGSKHGVSWLLWGVQRLYSSCKCVLIPWLIWSVHVH